MDSNFLQRDEGSTAQPGIDNSMTGTIEPRVPAALPNLEKGAAYNTEQIVQSNSLSNFLGVPEPVVRDSLQESLVRANAKRIEKNKMFAGWVAQSPQNATIAKDDIDNLTPVFGVLQELEQKKRDAEFGTITATPKTFFEKLQEAAPHPSPFGFAEAIEDLLRDPSDPSPPKLKSWRAYAERGAIDLVLNPVASAAIPLEMAGALSGKHPTIPATHIDLVRGGSTVPGDLAAAMNPPEKSPPLEFLGWTGKSLREKVQTIEDGLPELPQFEEGSADQYIADVVRMGPQIAAQVGAGWLTGGAGAALFMGSQTAGAQYRYLTDQGVDPMRAGLASIINAAAQAPLEYAGLSKMTGITGIGRALTGKALQKEIKKGAARKIIEGGLTEGGTEAFQQYIEVATTISALNEKENRTFGEGIQKFIDTLGDTTNEALYSGLVALPFGLLGGGGQALASRKSEAYAAQQKDLQEMVANTKIGSLSPELTQNLLEQNGLTGSDFIQGSVAFELFQSDPAFAAAFGLTQEQVAEAAAMGQDIEVPTAQLMTRLSKENYEKVVEVIRATPESMSLAEAQSKDRISDDVDTVLSAYQAQQEDVSEIALARQELRDGAIKAINEVPGLQTSASMAEGNVESYVDSWLKPIEAFAMRMSGSSGRSIADTFRKIAVSGLNRATVSQTSGNAFQPGMEGIRSANEALEKDSADFSTVVDAVAAKGQAPQQNLFMLKQTPLILRMIGKDFVTGKKAADGGLYVSPHTFDNALKGRHGVTLDMLKQIPKAMADPIAIFDSDSGKGKGDVVFMLELQDAQGKTVVVPVAFGTSRTKKEINIVKSAYGKGEKVPSVQWFLDQANKNARYMNGQKFGHWQEGSGVQFSSSYANVHGNNIYTEKDLVKLREQNPEMYQSAGNNARGSLEVRPEGYLVNLFKKADLSTLLHETGHIFLEEIETAIEAGIADESLQNDHATLKKWLGRFDDKAALQEEYKKSVGRTPAFKGRELSELSDAEKLEVRRIAEKEYFARGFEAYLMEGKAPSPALTGVFERFKNWLLSVYERAKKSLGVDLSDDVRGVFDRLLATEDEIDKVAVANELFALTQKQLDALGVKGAERNYQSSLIEAAKRRAVEKVQQARDKDRKTRIANWSKEAKEELLKDPVYAARSELYSKGGHLDADLVATLYGEDSLKELRKGVGGFGVKPNGQHPDIFAAKHGFADAPTMIAAIADAEGIGKRIKTVVDAMEAQYDASINPEPYLLETEEAARQVELVGQYLSRSLGKETIQRQAFERIAQQKLAAMPMGKARLSNQFTMAMRRALRAERIAISIGDFADALDANTQARLNLEFSKQSRAIGEMQESTERGAKRFAKMAKADPAARFIVNDIAARFGLMQYDQRLIDGKDADTATNWLNERIEDGFTIFLSELSQNGQKPWRDISVAEFESVSEDIAQVIAVERNTRKLMTAAGKASFEEAVNDAVETTFTYRKEKPLKTIEEQGFFSRNLARIHAAHTKIETLAVALDGGKALGDNWNLIYKPINDADNRRGVMFKELAKTFQSKDSFGAYSEKEMINMGRKKSYEPAIGESITKSQRIMVALNMGNEGNYSRLLSGHNWTKDQVSAVLESLDERDWNFVQKTWDIFESYKEESFNLQEEVSGQRPSSVEARPLKTRFGELRGGYFPVVYSHKHAKVDLQDKIITNDNPSFAMTKHGHLKERNSAGAGTPLNLDMSVIPARLQDIITDLCFRRPYIDVGRVLRNKQYRHSIEGTVGHYQYQAMISWLKDSARESKIKSDGETMAQWARGSATMMAMGYKFTTILAQPFGITQSTEALGAVNMLKGINMAYGKGPRATLELIKQVRSVSPMMDMRLKSFDRDVADATSSFAQQNLTPDSLLSALTSKLGLGKFEKWLKANAFVPMGVVQFGVDLPTWCGAYQKGLQDFSGSETKARDYADSVVRLTQGSGAAKDLSRIQRGSQYAKLFTMFYTYFNTLYNMTALRVADVNMNRDMPSVIRAANSFLLLYLIPSILTEIVAGRGPDDDEEFLAWSAKQLLMYPMQTVIGVRSLAGAIEGEFGYKASPAEAAPEAIYKFIVEVNKILTEDDYEYKGKKLAKLGLKTVGYVGGLPLGQAEISAFNVWDYLDGTNGDYEMRDMIFRRKR